MVAEALLVASATLVAVMVTLPTTFGARNLAVVFPKLPRTPADAVHVTPAPVTSFCRFAVKSRDCEKVAPPRNGVICTLIGDGGVDELLHPLTARTRHKAKLARLKKCRRTRFSKTRFTRIPLG